MYLDFTGSTQNSQTHYNVTDTAAVKPADSQTVSQGQANSLLQSGQVFSGEVAQIDGENVLLLLANRQTISAKLEGNVNLVLGQNVYFEVQSTANKQISLRPLFMNLSETDPAVAKALDAAQIPLSERSIQMTSAMMQEGMPINKNALLDMYQIVKGNEQVDPSVLVQMTKLGLPITEENIQQFEKYQDFNHQITHDLSNLAGDLPKWLGELADQGKMDDVFMIGRELFPAWNEDGTSSLLQQTENAKDQTGNVNEQAGRLSGQLSEELLKQLEVNGKAGNEQRQIPDSVLQKLNEMELPPELKAQLAQGTLTDAQTMELLSRLFHNQDEVNTQIMKNLMQNPEFKDLVKEMLNEQWTFKPEDFFKEEAAKEFYKNLNEQTGKLIQLMQNTGKADPAVMKSAANVQNNIGFMNQVNQMLTYVQIPLKLNQENAHGDLYVYTNKKNLEKKDGNVSALLHLEMETLGTMDIFVSMQDHKKVNTHFYLQKEEMIDFIEAHIGILNARLEKKGYSMSTNVSVKSEKSVSMADEFLDKGGEHPVTERIVSKVSFDVRA
ncbi:MAG: flagellar hook-length control protein FliK [Clostridia bacterium]|nr:flagellar hook-length control protein FliK [Clostridia bacterium]